MDDYLEFEKDTKVLKSINLDDFSIQDLKEYIGQLNKEIERVKSEVEKKLKSQIYSKKKSRNLNFTGSHGIYQKNHEIKNHFIFEQISTRSVE